MVDRSKHVQLDGREVIKTSAHLLRRINERFPHSGLGQVCLTIHDTCSETQAQIDALQKPLWRVRAVAIAIAAFSLFLLLYLLFGGIEWSQFSLPSTFPDFVAILEPSLGSVVFLTGYFFFVGTLETRWKQRRVLEALNELRSLAHVIDMHQLTKDPERLLLDGPDTASSPERSLSVFELGRYLDYCSEMLAILSKVSALWAQAFPEPALLAAVAQIELLTNGLSRKIWQKLMVLESVVTASKRTADTLESNVEKLEAL